MSNSTKPSKLLFVIGTFYAVIYSIYLLTNLFALSNTGSLNSVFYAVILITLVGLWGLWQQNKIFNKSFWKYFLIFQIVFSLVYFYTTYNLVKGINPIFINKIILFAPLCIIIYLYAFKNYYIWNAVESIENQGNKSLKNNLIFFIGLVVITLVYSPFPEKQGLTPTDYKTLAFQAGQRGDLIAAKRFGLKGIKEAKKLHQENTPVVAKIYHNLSVDTDARFNYKASYLYSMKAIKIYEYLIKEKKINKKGEEYEILAEDYYSVGTNDSVKNNKLKLSYINKALKISTERKDNQWITLNNQALGGYYKDIKNYKLSELYYKKAIAIAKQNKLNKNLADGYKLYAGLMFDQKKYTKAENLAQEAINILKKCQDGSLENKRQLGNSYNVLAKIEAKQGKCDAAMVNYSIGVPLMNQSAKLNTVAVNLVIKSFKDECKAPKTKKVKNNEY